MAKDSREAAQSVTGSPGSHCYPSGERFLRQMCLRGEISREELPTAGEHLAAILIAELQRKHPRPKGRVTVCKSCGGWSWHGRICRRCKRNYGPDPVPLVESCTASLAADHPYYRRTMNSLADDSFDATNVEHLKFSSWPSCRRGGSGAPT